MTPEELAEFLRSVGAEEQWKNVSGSRLDSFAALRRQREILVQLRAHLAAERDRALDALAEAKLERTRNLRGGGR